MNKILTLFLFLWMGVGPKVQGRSTQIPHSLQGFKPHMLGHVHEGCPANSDCLAQTGLRYKRWVNALQTHLEKGGQEWAFLDLFRQKNGIPLEIWGFPQGEGTKGFIHWDSYCQNHNEGEKEKRILLTLALAQNLKELEKGEKNKKILYIPRALLLKSEQNIREYKILRGATPLLINGDRLIYTKETKGIYYGLQILPTGDLQITKPISPQHYPYTVECPSSLVKMFSLLPYPKKLYQGLYCQALWDQKTQTYQTMIFGWSCH